MKPSRVSHNLMHITDWVPTLLAAAGKTDGKRQGKKRMVDFKIDGKRLITRVKILENLTIFP